MISKTTRHTSTQVQRVNVVVVVVVVAAAAAAAAVVCCGSRVRGASRVECVVRGGVLSADHCADGPVCTDKVGWWWRQGAGALQAA